MKLSIQNFGPISSAELDLSKDLIILTGENNTGKTYVANVVAALLDNNNFASVHFDSNSRINLSNLRISEIIEINLEDTIDQLIKSYNAFHSPLSWIEQYLQININDNSIFALSYNDTDHNFYKNQFYKSDFSDVYTPNTNKVSSRDVINGKRFISISKQVNSYILSIELENFESNELENAKSSLTILIADIISSFFKKELFFIPAERQGISLFSKELSLIKNQTFNTLISTTNGKRDELLNFFTNRFNRYPKSIQNALEFVQNLDSHRTRKSPFTYLADELDQLLQGKLSINEQGDILFHPKDDETLEISMTSSTVKSLSWLSIYLRHVAKQGDFIIIDEPELNLHPDNQVKIARFLSRLLNEGFKLMISTHSDYIIRELNTLIMLHSGYQKDKNESIALMEKYDYQQNELLDKDKVGVYLFRQGKAVENVLVEAEGFQIETIDKTVDKLNQSSQNIYFELF